MPKSGLPQDGRIKLKVSGREIDVRVSIIPMLYGEGVVLRLLDKERMKFDLRGVGMPEEVLKPFSELISLPHGIILVTGPTGSGKTTTLYGALNAIKDPTVKIITVEDPVEYHTVGISQIQVHSKIGLTFAMGLRSILRHDPDVILIGEIRDGETAQSAIQASLTGHLVFSTLHTNDACGAFTRLVDMGVEPYLVASTIEGVLAQRLVRLLCPRCKQAYRPDGRRFTARFSPSRLRTNCFAPWVAASVARRATWVVRRLRAVEDRFDGPSHVRRAGQLRRHPAIRTQDGDEDVAAKRLRKVPPGRDESRGSPSSHKGDVTLAPAEHADGADWKTIPAESGSQPPGARLWGARLR